MKRSDAIKQLNEFLAFYDLGCGEEILNYVEDNLGMEPPYDPSSDDEEPIYRWSDE